MSIRLQHTSSADLPTQLAGTLAERLCFDPHVVEHRDEQVAKGRVVVLVASNVAAMFESTAGKEVKR